MRVLIVEPLKAPYEREIGSDLKSMQTVVGGYIQAIYPFDDEEIALICNEEGKLLGLPFNRTLKDEEGSIYDVVVGTFFLCRAPAYSENFESLTDEQMAKLGEEFAYCYWCKNGDKHVVRFCTSWATKEENVDTLIAAL